MKKDNITIIVIAFLLFLFCATAGVITIVACGRKFAEVNDAHAVTAKLVSYTTRVVEESDGDYGYKTRTQYRCQWEYEVSGHSFNVTRNQYAAPSSTTTLYINNHWPYNVVSGEDGTDVLLLGIPLGLGAIILAFIFLCDAYREVKYPGTSFLSRADD